MAPKQWAYIALSAISLLASSTTSVLALHQDIARYKKHLAKRSHIGSSVLKVSYEEPRAKRTEVIGVSRIGHEDRKLAIFEQSKISEKEKGGGTVNDKNNSRNGKGGYARRTANSQDYKKDTNDGKNDQNNPNDKNNDKNKNDGKNDQNNSNDKDKNDNPNKNNGDNKNNPNNPNDKNNGDKNEGNGDKDKNEQNNANDKNNGNKNNGDNKNDQNNPNDKNNGDKNDGNSDKDKNDQNNPNDKNNGDKNNGNGDNEKNDHNNPNDMNDGNVENDKNENNPNDKNDGNVENDPNDNNYGSTDNEKNEENNPDGMDNENVENDKAEQGNTENNGDSDQNQNDSGNSNQVNEPNGGNTDEENGQSNSNGNGESNNGNVSNDGNGNDQSDSNETGNDNSNGDVKEGGNTEDSSESKNNENDSNQSNQSDNEESNVSEGQNKNDSSDGEEVEEQPAYEDISSGKGTENQNIDVSQIQTIRIPMFTVELSTASNDINKETFLLVINNYVSEFFKQNCGPMLNFASISLLLLENSPMPYNSGKGGLRKLQDKTIIYPMVGDAVFVSPVQVDKDMVVGLLVEAFAAEEIPVTYLRQAGIDSKGISIDFSASPSVVSVPTTPSSATDGKSDGESSISMGLVSGLAITAFVIAILSGYFYRRIQNDDTTTVATEKSSVTGMKRTPTGAKKQSIATINALRNVDDETITEVNIRHSPDETNTSVSGITYGYSIPGGDAASVPDYATTIDTHIQSGMFPVSVGSKESELFPPSLFPEGGGFHEVWGANDYGDGLSKGTDPKSSISAGEQNYSLSDSASSSTKNTKKKYGVSVRQKKSTEVL